MNYLNDKRPAQPVVEGVLECKNPNYTVLVLPYAFGQYRIQLTDKRKPDDYAPEGHGSIVRELCTYQASRAALIVTAIAASEEPEAFCESLANPHNCEYLGGRIRLDNEPLEEPF